MQISAFGRNRLITRAINSYAGVDKCKDNMFHDLPNRMLIEMLDNKIDENKKQSENDFDNIFDKPFDGK